MYGGALQQCRKGVGVIFLPLYGHHLIPGVYTGRIGGPLGLDIADVVPLHMQPQIEARGPGGGGCARGSPRGFPEDFHAHILQGGQVQLLGTAQGLVEEGLQGGAGHLCGGRLEGALREGFALLHALPQQAEHVVQAALVVRELAYEYVQQEAYRLAFHIIGDTRITAIGMGAVVVCPSQEGGLLQGHFEASGGGSQLREGFGPQVEQPRLGEEARAKIQQLFIIASSPL